MTVDPGTLVQGAAATLGAVKAAEPVVVTSTGWSPTTYGVWALVILMTPILIALFRMWPSMRKLRNESDGSLRQDLLARIKALEEGQTQEREDCQRRLTAMQNKMDAVTRQFVQFQLTVVRYMPEEFAPHAQRAAANLMAVIAKDVGEFADPDPQSVADVGMPPVA